MILDLINSIHNRYVNVDIDRLPTRGMFNPKDFTIKIKAASEKDIFNFEETIKNIDKNKQNRYVPLYEAIINIVNNNSYFGKYNCNYLNVKDVIPLFFEIVNLTKKETLNITVFEDYIFDDDSDLFYTQDIKIKEEILEVNLDNFNVSYDYNESIYNYDDHNRWLVINGLKTSPPTVGAHLNLMNFLNKNNLLDNDDIILYFIFFLKNVVFISDEEIINLITIFNDEMGDEDLNRYLETTNIIESLFKITISNYPIDELFTFEFYENIWKED